MALVREKGFKIQPSWLYKIHPIGNNKKGNLCKKGFHHSNRDMKVFSDPVNAKKF